MYNYFDAKYLVRFKNMIIHKALLLYGYSNFTLEILEYCKPGDLTRREQHFIDLVQPKYNILKTARSSLGFKHTEETLAKLRARQHTQETKVKMSEARAGYKHSEESKKKTSEALIGRKKAEGAGRPSQKIVVFDNKTNLTTTYESIREAARALGVGRTSISDYFARSSQKPFKGRYIFTKT
jgi:group I intron endonuclease